MLGGKRICRGFAEEFFAFELEFLPPEIEVGQFLDVGEQFRNKRRSGIPAHVLESCFMKEVIHDALDAGGLVEVGLFLHIDDDVENGTRGGAEVFGPPGIAETLQGGVADVETETLRWWGGDLTQNFGETVDLENPFGEFVGLIGVQGVEEGIGALFGFERFDFDLEEAIGSRRRRRDGRSLANGGRAE